MNVLKELLAKNLIIKRDVKNEDNSRYCNYRVNPKFVFGELEKSSQGDVKNFPEKCEKFSHHNIVHTINTYNREFITNSLLDFNSQIDNLDSFTQTIESWLSYKKSRKQSYASNVTILAFIKKLIKFSSGKHLLAKEIVENSIANNWAGIYELKGNNSKVSNPIIEQVEPTIFDDNYKIVSEEQQEEYIQQMRERRLKGGTNK